MHISPVTLEVQILQRNSFGESGNFLRVECRPCTPLTPTALGASAHSPLAESAPSYLSLAALSLPWREGSNSILSFLFEQSSTSTTLPRWDLRCLHHSSWDCPFVPGSGAQQLTHSVSTLIKWVHKNRFQNEWGSSTNCSNLTIFKSLFVSVFINKKNLKLEVSGLC